MQGTVQGGESNPLAALGLPFRHQDDALGFLTELALFLYECIELNQLLSGEGPSASGTLLGGEVALLVELLNAVDGRFTDVESCGDVFAVLSGAQGMGDALAKV